MKKKITTLVLLLAFAAVAVTGGTLAYFTDTKEVVNTFTVGKVAITLDESKVTEEGETDGDTRVAIGQKYRLVPGKTYVKDPTIHVEANSENCYLFVKVDNALVNHGVEATSGDGYTLIAGQMSNNGWTPVDSVDNVYVLGSNTTPSMIVKSNSTASQVIFRNFKISEATTAGSLSALNGQSITVSAYAIQASGFESTSASAIWSAGGFN